MLCAADNHNKLCHICAKEFLKLELYLGSQLAKMKKSIPDMSLP